MLNGNCGAAGVSALQLLCRATCRAALIRLADRAQSPHMRVKTRPHVPHLRPSSSLPNSICLARLLGDQRKRIRLRVGSPHTAVRGWEERARRNTGTHLAAEHWTGRGVFAAHETPSVARQLSSQAATTIGCALSGCASLGLLRLAQSRPSHVPRSLCHAPCAALGVRRSVCGARCAALRMQRPVRCVPLLRPLRRCRAASSA